MQAIFSENPKIKMYESSRNKLDLIQYNDLDHKMRTSFQATSSDFNLATQ